jgi:hypothetical protein
LNNAFLSIALEATGDATLLYLTLVNAGAGARGIRKTKRTLDRLAGRVVSPSGLDRAFSLKSL